MAAAFRRLETERRPAAAPAPSVAAELDRTGLLALQRGAGNAAVARMLARAPRSHSTGETYTDTSAELFSSGACSPRPPATTSSASSSAPSGTSRRRPTPTRWASATRSSTG